MKKNKFLNRILAFSLATIMAISSTGIVANAATADVPSGGVMTGHSTFYGGSGTGTYTSSQIHHMFAIPVISVTPLSNIAKGTADESTMQISLDGDYTPYAIKDKKLIEFIVPKYINVGNDDVDIVARFNFAEDITDGTNNYEDEIKDRPHIVFNESGRKSAFTICGNFNDVVLGGRWGISYYQGKTVKNFFRTGISSAGYRYENNPDPVFTGDTILGYIDNAIYREGYDNYTKLLKALNSYKSKDGSIAMGLSNIKMMQTVGLDQSYPGLWESSLGWSATPMMCNSNQFEFGQYVKYRLSGIFDKTYAFHTDLLNDSCVNKDTELADEFTLFLETLGMPTDEPILISEWAMVVSVCSPWTTGMGAGNDYGWGKMNSSNYSIVTLESFAIDDIAADFTGIADHASWNQSYALASYYPAFMLGERDASGYYYTSDEYIAGKGTSQGAIPDKTGYEPRRNTMYYSTTFFSNDVYAPQGIPDGLTNEMYGTVDVAWNENSQPDEFGSHWVLANTSTTKKQSRGYLMAVTNTTPGGKKVVAQKNAEVSFSQYNYSDYVTQGNLNKNYVWTPAENSTSVTTVKDVDNNVVKAGKADYQGSGLQVGQTLPDNKSTTVKVINGDILTMNKDNIVKYEASKDNNANKNAFETKYTAPTVSSGYKLGLSTYMTDYVDVNLTVKDTYEAIVKNQQVGVKLRNDTLTGEKQVGSVITVNDVPFFPKDSRSKITAGSYSHLAKQNGLLVHTIGTDFSYYSYRTSASYYTSGGKAYKKDNNDLKVATYVNLKDKDWDGVASMQLFTDANTKLAAKSINGATTLLFSFPFTSGAKMKYNPEKGDKLATIEAASDKPQRLLTNYNVFVKLPKVHSELYVVDTQLTVGEGGKCTIHLGTPEYKSKTEDYLISKDPNDDDAKNRIELPEDTMGYIAVPLAWFRNNQDVFSATTTEITSLKSDYIGSLLTKIAGSVNKPQEYIAESGEMGNEDIFVGASAYTSGGFAVIAIMGITDVTVTTDTELLSYQINRIYPDLVWNQLGAEHFFNTKTDEKNIYKFKSESRDCYMLQSTYCAQGYYNKQVKDATINAYKDVVESSNATYHQNITGYRSDADKAKYFIYSKGYEIEKPVYNNLGQQTGTIKAWVGGNFNTYDKIEGINFNTVWKGAANNSQSWSAKSGDSYRYGVGVFTYGLNLTRKDFDDVKTISTLTTNGGVGNADVLAKVVDYAGGGQDNKPSDKYLKITTYNLPTAQVSKTNYSKIDWSGDLDSYNNDGHKRVKDTKKPSNCTYNLNGMPVKFNSTTITHTVPATATTQATTHQHTHYYDGRYANVPNAPTPAFTTPDSYIYKWVYYNGYNFMNILDKGTDIHRVLTVSVLEGGIKGAHLEINEKAFKYMPDDKGVKDSTKSDEMLKNTLGDTSNVNGTLMFRDAKIDNVTLKYYPEVLMRWYVNTNSAENVLTKQDDVTYGSVKVMGDVKRQSTSSGLYIYTVNDGYNNADIIDYGNSKTINKLTNDKKVSGVTVSSGYQTSQDTSGLPIMYAGSDVTLNVEAKFTINLYGYMVDVINKDTDDNDNGLVSATIPSITEGNLPTTVEETNVTLANVKYNTIVNDNKDIYEIWGNSDSTDKLFNTYKDWTKSMLDVKKYKPQVTLDIDNGGKKYNDFNVTFGKFAVVKDNKVGVAFNKDTNNKADGVFSLNIENGKVVKLVQKEGSNTKYYDSKYLALLIQIADDANISLAEADKMFDASDLQNSILEAIQSSTDSYNKSAKDDSEKAEEYLGNGTNWYDEKVKTIVIRRYVTDSVTPSGISLNDKIDYNVIGNQTNANDKNKHNAKWNFSFIFDVADTDMKNKLSGSNVDGNKITVYGDQHVDGADFAIKNSSEDAGE